MPQSADTGWMGQQMLYPLDDPNTAFRNALQDIGVNPFKSNPFVTQLSKAAQGARIAFLGRRGGPPSAGPGQTYTNPSTDYGGYLRNALQGGSMLNELHGSAMNFGGLLNQVKALEAQMAGGDTTAVNRSPYTAALRDIFASDDGMGALGAYASLRTPALGALGTSYNRSLQNAGQGAMRRFATEGGLNSSPWDWLFPNGGAGLAF